MVPLMAPDVAYARSRQIPALVSATIHNSVRVQQGQVSVDRSETGPTGIAYTDIPLRPRMRLVDDDDATPTNSNARRSYVLVTFDLP